MTLKTRAIVDGFINIPIKVHVSQTWTDDLTTASCPFVEDVYNQRKPSDFAYEDVMYIKDTMAPFYAEVFNVSADMTWNEGNTYSDALISQMFEGIPQKIDWTEEQLYLIENT